MPDSDARLNDDPTAQAVRELAGIIRKQADGRPILTGEVEVMLVLNVEDALTPQDAVESAIHTVASVGYNAFYFMVTEKATETKYFVRAGELMENFDDIDPSDDA